MPFEVLAEVLVEGGNFVSVGREDWEVNDEWAATALDNLLGNNLVGAGVVYACIVDPIGKFISLDLIISQFGCDKLNNKVIFERLQLGIVSQVSEQGLRANSYLGVNQVTSHFILECLLL